MNRDFGLIITDASPLITLAVTDNLHLLSYLGIPVRVPDAVYAEVVERFPEKAGARQIGEWLADNPGYVHFTPTVIGRLQARLIADSTDPKDRIKDVKNLGEQAAIEIANRQQERNPGSRTLLMYEDSGVIARRPSIAGNVNLLSTGDLLHTLERAKLIQSADQVLDQAQAQGRNVSHLRQERLNVEARHDLQQQLEQNRDDGLGWSR